MFKTGINVFYYLFTSDQPVTNQYHYRGYHNNKYIKSILLFKHHANSKTNLQLNLEILQKPELGLSDMTVQSSAHLGAMWHCKI